jgi:hypothetical protein
MSWAVRGQQSAAHSAAVPARVLAELSEQSREGVCRSSKFPVRILVCLSLKPPRFIQAHRIQKIREAFPALHILKRHLRRFFRATPAGRGFGADSKHASSATNSERRTAAAQRATRATRTAARAHASVRSNRELFPACRSCLRSADANRHDAV